MVATLGSAIAEPAAVAMNAEARGHYERGLALYGDKDYAGAIAELEAGYAIDPRREFLFAQAQALRLNGDCKSAVPLYKKFLDSGPDDVQTNAAHIALGRCAEQMARTPVVVAPPLPDVAKRAAVATTTTATIPPPQAPPPPWYQDVAGGVLLGSGVAALAIGTAFTFAVLSARDDANQSSSSYADYAQHWATARERSHVAIGAFSVGAAFTGAAIYRYLRVRHRSDATGIIVGVSAGAGARAGIGLGIGGRF